jgi:hypothetical protein
MISSRRGKVALLLVPLVAAVTLMAVSEQGGPVRFARIDDNRSVAVVDGSTGSGRRVYTSSVAVDALTISPAGDRLAFTELQGGTGELVRASLVVIDAQGVVLHRIDDANVQRYTWCGVECIAYIAGETREGGVGFMPQGAFVVNLQGGTRTPVTGVPSAYALTWASFDSSLYFKVFARAGEPRVFRHGLPDGPTTPTPFLDFNFSPSGRYYLRGFDGEQAAELYATQPHQAVALPSTRGLGIPVGWAFDRGEFLLIARRTEPADRDTTVPGIRRGTPGPVEFAVYDVQARRVTHRNRGELVGWARARGILAFVSDGRVTVVAQP